MPAAAAAAHPNYRLLVRPNYDDEEELGKLFIPFFDVFVTMTMTLCTLLMRRVSNFFSPPSYKRIFFQQNGRRFGSIYSI